MIIFDTETTGLLVPGVEDPAKQPRIIELAAIRWSAFYNEIQGKFTALFNPGMALPPEIVKITKLTDKDLVNAPTFVEVLPDLIEFWREDADNGVVAHNLPFDLGMLVFELRRCGWEHRFPYCQHQFDTVGLSGGKRLEAWSREVQGDKFVAQSHRAMDDVLRLLDCWKTLNLS